MSVKLHGKLRINTNDYVKVLLTDAGMEVLKKKLPHMSGLTDHSLEMQLWELMSVFGESFFVGADAIFVNNDVEIDI